MLVHRHPVGRFGFLQDASASCGMLRRPVGRFVSASVAIAVTKILFFNT